MRTAKIFKSGNSMAVRLPKDIHFNSNEVEIIKRGDEIILKEKPHNLYEALVTLPNVTDDFFAEKRFDLPPQEREWF